LVLGLNRVAQDMPNLLFHAALVLRGAALETRLDVVLQVSNNELSHNGPPRKQSCYHDIATRRLMASFGRLLPCQEQEWHTQCRLPIGQPHSPPSPSSRAGRGSNFLLESGDQQRGRQTNNQCSIDGFQRTEQCWADITMSPYPSVAKFTAE
jgi:hypothetical protein